MSKNLPLELLQEAERIAKSAVENYSEALKLVQETGDISQKIILHIKLGDAHISLSSNLQDQSRVMRGGGSGSNGGDS